MKYNHGRHIELIDEKFERLQLRILDQTKPFGNFAIFDLQEIIDLCLVGQHQQAAVFLPRVIEWLDAAIAKKEVFGTWFFHASNLHQARAIAGWMYDDSDCFDHWDLARSYFELAWEEPIRSWPAREVVANLDDYLMFAVLAGSQANVWQNAVSMYDNKVGPKVVSVKTTRRLREYCYVILQNHIGQRVESDSDLLLAGRKVLRSGLYERWLGSGQILRAISVLKLVYVNRYRSPNGASNTRLSALETIFRAFDDMPEIPRPLFLGSQQA